MVIQTVELIERKKKKKKTFENESTTIKPSHVLKLSQPNLSFEPSFVADSPINLDRSPFLLRRFLGPHTTALLPFTTLLAIESGLKRLRIVAHEENIPFFAFVVNFLVINSNQTSNPRAKRQADLPSDRQTVVLLDEAEFHDR
jgi:hypothetical protein